MNKKNDTPNLYNQKYALLSGKQRPCAYTREEMAESLHEAEADYKAGRYVSHENLFIEIYRLHLGLQTGR